MVELRDHRYSPVPDVQAAVALSKLDAVAYGEAAPFHALHLKRAAVLRVDDAGEAAHLELEPQEVPPFVDADHACPLAGLDVAAVPHEAQHITHVVARSAALLFARQVSPHHYRCFDAPSLEPASFDEGFPDAAVQVLAFGIARGDDDAATTVRDEIPRDRLVPHAGVRDLHHPAGLLEKLHRARSAPHFGRG